MMEKLKNQSQSLIQAAINSLGYEYNNPTLDILPEASNASIATPVAFKIAQEEGNNPQDIAEDIVNSMDFSDYDYIKNAENHGPYINIYATDVWFNQVITSAIDDDYGKNIITNKKTISVEHTSVNPTGPLHIGRTRNSVLGDTIANLLEFVGHNVTRDYYVNDAGLQVSKLVWGVNHYSEDKLEEPNTKNKDSDLVRYYRKANFGLDNDILTKLQKGEVPDEDHENEKEVIDILQGLESGDQETINMVREVVEEMLKAQVGSLDMINISFDNFTYETEYMISDETEWLLEKLKEMEITEKKNGAWVVELEDQDFVFQRSNGTTLYGTRDILYHIDKTEAYDESIIVLGEDQELQADSVHSIVGMLGYDRKKLSAVHHAFVNTPEGGMSTRLGEGDFLYDVMERSKEKSQQATNKELDEKTVEDIAVGSLRYNLLSKKRKQLVTFDADQAVSVKSQTGASVQYAYARLCGIKENAETDVGDNADLSSLSHSSEIQLAQKLSLLPLKIQSSIDDYEPQVLAVYAEELKELINQFYKDCQVSGIDDESKKKARISLVIASMNVLESLMSILGMPAIEEM